MLSSCRIAITASIAASILSVAHTHRVAVNKQLLTSVNNAEGQGKVQNVADGDVLQPSVAGLPRGVCPPALEAAEFYENFGNEDKKEGQGSFGNVYKVKQISTGKVWAGKILNTRGIANMTRAGGVEIKVQALRLPFNADIQDVFQDGGSVKIVSSYCAGRELNKYAGKGSMTNKHLKSIAAQLAFGIWQLHLRGIVHRDFKTENAMFVDKEHTRAIVIDYGLAQMGCTGGTCSSKISGTPDCMAPRQYLGQPYGLEVDWWAWGYLMFEMMFNSIPYGAGQNARGHAHVTEGCGERTLCRQALSSLSSRSSFQILLKDILQMTMTPLRDYQSDPTIPYVDLDPSELYLEHKRDSLRTKRVESHPVLNHPFWLDGEATNTTIEKYWQSICKLSNDEASCLQSMDPSFDAIPADLDSLCTSKAAPVMRPIVDPPPGYPPGMRPIADPPPGYPPVTNDLPFHCSSLIGTWEYYKGSHSAKSRFDEEVVWISKRRIEISKDDDQKGMEKAGLGCKLVYLMKSERTNKHNTDRPVKCLWKSHGAAKDLECNQAKYNYKSGLGWISKTSHTRKVRMTFSRDASNPDRPWMHLKEEGDDGWHSPVDAFLKLVD